MKTLPSQNTPSATRASIMQRRSFIKGILAAGTFPFIASATPLLFGAEKGAKPSQKVKIAYIGIGNQGAVDIARLEKTGLTEVVALCDTEIDGRRKKVKGGTVFDFSGGGGEKGAGDGTLAVLKQFPGVPRFRDFREMFDKVGRQIDAVLIATPDFSHFPAAILAMSLGKHVYV
ncbi:MAG: Gfo/Idh/MocA family oxidoreductase, partial [Opitutaceae bacterium]|nr:Gfo/Idh/MocA family oxidoreductase [Opitutaceae bacterium]